MADAHHLRRLTADLIDQGKLIEAGWTSLRLAALPLDMPAQQLEEMRAAFFGGAHHVFASIMCTVGPGDEPSEEDLRRVQMIEQELAGFIQQYELKHFRTKGSA